MESIWFAWQTNPLYSDMLSREITRTDDLKKSNSLADKKRVEARRKRRRKNKILKRKRNGN